MNRCRKFVFFLIKLPTTGDAWKFQICRSSGIQRGKPKHAALKVSCHAVPAYPFDDASQLLFINAKRDEAKL
jgi:hypothetical protein